ncbi:ATP-binding protein [Acinetobacter baumannii]|nr:ATP-binding protein [Acinetobacter baumannii]
MNFEIPLIDSGKLNISFESDKPTFILGANGTGKSSLIYSIFRQFPEINIISAHRANWLDQESISLGGNTKEQYESWIKGSLLSDNARWSENHYLDKPKINLINLIDSEHKRAREITDLVDKDLFDEVKILKSEQSIVNKINELFRSCNLGIEINVASNSQINAIKNDHIYSVSKMSDGERNALLIASNVLLTKLDSLIIIDEPERHLHHSITIPFVNNLIKLRPDLKFIISTHDIGFAQSFDDSQFILLNGCNYINQHSIVWDAQLLSSENLSNLEHISRNILGSRKKIIFIEGENNSLDIR